MTIRVPGNDANAFIDNVKAVFAHDDIKIKGAPPIAVNADHQITIQYKNKTIGLTDLQQATELKIQHLEHALLQVNTADRKEQHWNVADLTTQLAQAKKLRTLLNRIAQPQIIKKMNFRSQAFSCTPAKISEFKQDLKTIFDDRIQLIEKSGGKAVFIRSGKKISYAQLMNELESQKTALAEQLTQLQTQFEDFEENQKHLSQLIADVKNKIATANDLANKLRVEKPQIGKIGLFEKNKITESDFPTPQEFVNFSEAVNTTSKNIGVVVIGTDSLQFFQGNHQINLETFKHLCQKQRDKLQRQINLREQKQRNKLDSKHLEELRTQHATITNTLDKIENIKDSTSSIRKIASWCFREFRALFTLEKKISFKASKLTRDSTLTTLKKLDTVFSQSIQFKEKAFFRDSVTITEFGESLSKEELCVRVSDKIDQLRHQILFSTDETKKQASADLKNLQDIHTLLTEKMGEHRAIKVYIGSVLLLPLILITLPSLLLKQAAHRAALSWKARRLEGKISYLKGINFHSISDPEIKAKALALKGTLNRQSQMGFAQAYRELIALASTPNHAEDLQIIHDTIKSQGNYLLKLALRNGQPEAAKFLIQEGFFKNVSSVQGKKISELMKNQLSLNTTVLEELDKSPYLTPAQRNDLYKALYANSPDGVSMGRIINHLLARGQNDLAEQVVLKDLERLESGAPLTPEQTIKINASQLLAAKIGSSKLLKAAFGVNELDTPEQIKNNSRVKASLYLPNTKNKTLLHFACEGSMANFVIGVDQAMRAFDNDNDQLKQHLSSCIEKIPLFGKMTLVEEADICEKLPFLKEKFEGWHAEDLSNRELKMLLQTQLRNLLESPFDVRDVEGSKPIQKLNMSLAISLDKAANVPHCFTNAVAYYNYVNSPTSKIVFVSILSIKLATCIGISFLEPYASQLNVFEKNILFQPLTLGEIGIGAAIGIMVTKPYHRLMARHWKGVSQQHAAYELKPENQLTSWNAKKIKSLSEARAKIIKNRNWDLKARISSKGNPYTVSMSAGLTALRSHSVKDAITRFKEIPTSVDSKPIKTDSAYASAVIEAYQEVIYGKEHSASADELFSTLFDRFESVEDLKQMFNTHMKQGPNGIAFVAAQIEKMIEKAIADPSTFSSTQYAACLLQAVELGRSDLKTRLWSLPNQRMAFESSQGWSQFGALLLTSAATKNYGSDTAYAQMASEIFTDWELANQISLRASNEDILDPYTISLVDMSLQRAQAFDTVMGRNPETSNSYTKMIQQRDKTYDLEVALDFTSVGAVKFILDPAGLVIDLVADTARVGGGIVGGPVGAALAGGLATFTLETILIIAGYVGGLHSAKGVAEAWSRSRTFWNRFNEKISKLPGSHEDHRKMKAVFGVAIRAQLLQAIDTYLVGEHEQLSESDKASLAELKQNIKMITEGGFGPTTLAEISRAIIHADLTPDQRTRIIQAFKIDDPAHVAGLIVPALVDQSV